MHDRAVGAGAGDGVEATGRAACRSPGAAPAGGRRPRSRASLPLVDSRREPAEEAADRGAVAAMGGADALELDGVLARLGQRHRDRHRARSWRPPPAGASPPRYGAVEVSISTRLPILPSVSSAAPSSSGGASVTALPSQATRAVGHLAAVHVEIDMTVGVQQGEAQRERRARHVAAAHVQQPGDRIGRGEQRHVGALGGDDVGDARALGARCSRRRTRRDAAAPARAAAAAGRATPRRRDWTRPARSSPPARCAARAKRSWPSTVCSQGSKPSLPPFGRFSAIQASGDSSGIWCGTKASVSTWARTASV